MLDTPYLQSAAADFLKHLLTETEIGDYWFLKDFTDGPIHKVKEYSDGDYESHYLLLSDEPDSLLIYIFVEIYPDYSLDNSLWIGVQSRKKSALADLIEWLQDTPFAPAEGVEESDFDKSRVHYDEIGRGEYYLGIYENKIGPNHEPLHEYLMRCSQFLQALCEYRQPITEAAEAIEEIKRLSRTGTVSSRPGQKQFSQIIRRNYSRRCAVTESSVPEVLEAAHIRTAEGRDFNGSTNGILLRADIHALFDNYLITLSEDGCRIEVSPELNDKSYDFLRGAKIRQPAGPAPSHENIRHHREQFLSRAARGAAT